MSDPRGIIQAESDKPTPYIEQLCELLHNRTCETNRNSNRIHDIVDKLVGTIPSNESEKVASPEHFGLHDIDYRMDELAKAIGYLNDAITRLEEADPI